MLKKFANILVRTLGVLMFAFIPGMAVAGPSGLQWWEGGMVGVATVVSSIIIFFGVQLAWDGHISEADISKGFRAAVAKHAEDNEEVMDALQSSAEDELDLSKFEDTDDVDEDVIDEFDMLDEPDGNVEGDLDELEDEQV